MELHLLLLVCSGIIGTQALQASPSCALYNCVLENFGKGKTSTEPCVQCFIKAQSEVDPTMVLAGLNFCAAEYIPLTHEICSEGSYESPGFLQDCFEDTLETMAAERCLLLNPQGLKLRDAITTGANCLIE